MHSTKSLSYLIFSLLVLFCSLVLTQCKSNTQKPISAGDIQLPEGFEIEVYAENVTNARAMTLADDGTLYVGSRGEGKVYAIIDADKDYVADEIKVIAEGIERPVGVDLKDGDLYISAVRKVVKISNVANNMDNATLELVTDELPENEHHGWKFIRFGPDGYLYVPVGAPCNICESEDSIFASITRLDVTSGETTPEIVAKGVRNTVGFDWHPTTGELWFTDNGRDWLGDDSPPCELNRLASFGDHFGYPYCHGTSVDDPDFGGGKNCEDYVKPVQDLGPHVAPLGMRFYTGTMFPEKYRGMAFIAEHGSWNRSTKIGYRVMTVGLNGNTSTGYEVFASGWEKDGEVVGRPVDVLQMPDGSLLVSDDFGNRIYRITYKQ